MIHTIIPTPTIAMFLTDMFLRIIGSSAVLFFPLLASRQALHTADPAQLSRWLQYWCMLSCILLIESCLIPVLACIPFYSATRFLFLLYLVSTQSRAGRQLHETIIRLFTANQGQVDNLADGFKSVLEGIGISLLRKVISWLITLRGVRRPNGSR